MCRALEKEFSTEFSMKIIGSVNHILGMNVRNSDEYHTVHMSQTQYTINENNNFQQHRVYCYGTPMDLKAQLSKSQCLTKGLAEAAQMKNMTYRELIGSLLWVANGTRPDVSFTVNTLAKFTSNPELVH
jgi:hypothetical protein